jgi:hypothetical protein
VTVCSTVAPEGEENKVNKPKFNQPVLRSQILTLVSVNVVVFWVMTSCSLVDKYQRF